MLADKTIFHEIARTLNACLTSVPNCKFLVFRDRDESELTVLNFGDFATVVPERFHDHSFTCSNNFRTEPQVAAIGALKIQLKPHEGAAL